MEKMLNNMTPAHMAKDTKGLRDLYRSLIPCAYTSTKPAK